MISKRSICYSLEGFRTTSTEVEDAGNAIFQEPQVYICHVAHIDEVAFKVLATFEQLRCSPLLSWVLRWKATLAMLPLWPSRGP